jgi:hypothetical protein
MASRVRKRIQTATSWGGSRHITTGVIKRRLRLLAVILNQVIRVAECQPRDRILKMRTKEKGFKLLVPVFGWFASDVVMMRRLPRTSSSCYLRRRCGQKYRSIISANRRRWSLLPRHVPRYRLNRNARTKNAEYRRFNDGMIAGALSQF